MNHTFISHSSWRKSKSKVLTDLVSGEGLLPWVTDIHLLATSLPDRKIKELSGRSSLFSKCTNPIHEGCILLT